MHHRLNIKKVINKKIINIYRLIIVGRLQRVLDGKIKDVANKPKNKTTKKRPVRTEKLPEWFEEETNGNPVIAASDQTQEKKKQEIEDMLKRLRA